MIAHWLTLLPATVAAGGWLVPLVDLLRHPGTIADLEKTPPAAGSDLPPVSVVFAARDEAATIEPAARSLLALDYPALEIVAANDRSADATGEILARLAGEDSRLRPVSISVLPPGWLGKNHALSVGAAAAAGRYILFTDADVHFAPDALRRAVALMEERSLDHLVAGADVLPASWMERAVLGFFMCAFMIHFRPWRIPDPRSTAHVGIGAFNMVRAETYRAAGGHAAMPMDVLDDVKLGKMMKRHGGRALFANGGKLVRVRWVEGIGGLVRGLEKNSFAGFGFSPAYAIAGIAAVFAMTLWPWIGLFAGPWLARLLSLGALIGMFGIGRAFSPEPRGWSQALGFPIAGFVVAATIARSMFVTYRQGGIRWRGTLYPLAELKKGIY